MSFDANLELGRRNVREASSSRHAFLAGREKFFLELSYMYELDPGEVFENLLVTSVRISADNQLLQSWSASLVPVLGVSDDLFDHLFDGVATREP